MATHSSVFVWKIPWTEEPGGYSPWGCTELDMTEQLTRTHSNKKKKTPKYVKELVCITKT